jgi:endonuclease/exonuclease/phosphatase family metal-dependent hydrolase
MCPAKQVKSAGRGKRLPQWPDIAADGLRASGPAVLLQPTAVGMLPVMRLDHVLVSRTATVPVTRPIRVPYTDHHGVLVAIEFTRKPDRQIFDAADRAGGT